MTTRIVIGDDHPLVRAGLRTALSSVISDLEVIECHSLDEVMETLSASAGDVDLVLWDLTMPGIRGFAGLLMLLAQCQLLSFRAGKIRPR